MATLQFAPFCSTLDAGFWHKLSQNKLDVYGLDDKVRSIEAHYVNGDAQGLPSRVTLDLTSFESSYKVPPRCFPCHGALKNTNTIEEFKNSDKKQILEELAATLWHDIISGACIADPALLSRFFLLTHADLKKYHYYYWFAFPAFSAPDDVIQTHPPRPITARFTEQQLHNIEVQYDAVCIPQQAGFFLIHEGGMQNTTVMPLSQFDTAIATPGTLVFCVCDPCTLDSNPGWPLRNFLTLIAFHWSAKLGDEIEVLCLRDRFKDGVRSMAHSIVLNLKLPSIAQLKDPPKCVGWEKNERQKFGPRMVNLSATMDPSRLAESAVDLNLKLMRWRLLPQLNLEAIAGTKCLLLGSGTLGCNVARCLLGWGVRNITLVDNGKVSYSNPVRQSLFTFEDSLNGGRPKAEAAAAALRLIFPGVVTITDLLAASYVHSYVHRLCRDQWVEDSGVNGLQNAVGLSLSIPMPGHTVVESQNEQTQADVNQLEDLVRGHDVVFLLMDTRESRWLPTLMAGVHGKIVINAALGFDTYLVMRHGVKSLEEGATDTDVAGGMGGMSLKSSISGRHLGCYFCNDVVAPGDSTRDRTLDQQCTVSRPGMSYLASALAVELLTSVIVHPLQGAAPAEVNASEDAMLTDTDSPLGLVPHQLRGFLSRFQQVMPACRAFDKCTACSYKVIDSYKKDGFQFLLNVFNQPKYLEDLTGLTQLHMETIDSEVWELSDDDSMSI